MTIDERVKDEIPQLTRLVPVEGEPDACDVVVTTGALAWVFRISRIIMRYDGLHSLTGVEWMPANGQTPRNSVGLPLAGFSPIHLDWRSGSNMDAFERRLQRYFEPNVAPRNCAYPWASMMQFAANRLNEFLLQVGDLQPAEFLTQGIPAPEYLVNPLWPKSNRPVVWYGQGETAKGMMALGAAVCMCYGQRFASLTTKELPLGLIYVDYEDSHDEFTIRVNRLSNGLDVAPVPTLRRFDPQGRLFVDIADTLKAKVAAAGGCDGYIIDSAIPACGGDVNKPEPVGAFFAAVARLGKPAIVIAHETKDSNLGASDASPFGSQVWRTSAAMTVNFQASREPQINAAGHSTLDILLRCTKANNVRRFPPFAFQLEFTRDKDDDEVQGALGSRPVQASTWIRQIDPTTVATDLQSKLPPVRRIASFLKDNQGATVKDIAEGTGLDRKAVSSALRNKIFESEQSSAGRGQTGRWNVIEGGLH